MLRPCHVLSEQQTIRGEGDRHTAGLWPHRSDIVALWRAAKSSHARRQALGGEFDQTEARALRALSILFASVCLFIWFDFDLTIWHRNILQFTCPVPAPPGGPTTAGPTRRPEEANSARLVHGKLWKIISEIWIYLILFKHANRADCRTARILLALVLQNSKKLWRLAESTNCFAWRAAARSFRCWCAGRLWMRWVLLSHKSWLHEVGTKHQIIGSLRNWENATHTGCPGFPSHPFPVSFLSSSVVTGLHRLFRVGCAHSCKAPLREKDAETFTLHQ